MRELASGPGRIRALLRGLEEAAADASAAEGAWSIRTVVAHLRDLESMVMRPRLERLIAEDGPLVTPFDETTWEHRRRVPAESLASSLASFVVQRAATTGILRQLDPAAWARSGRHPQSGDFTLHQWVEHIVAHDAEHISQIEGTLRA